MKNYLKSYKKLKGEGTIWGLALRQVNGKYLYDGNFSEFTIIKNSFRYWRADPFLFEHNGETYIFAELFDRLKAKGKIGVAKIKNGKCGKFKICLDLPWHLSYPCVYKKNNKIYMVPECARSGKITVYKSKNFPYEWEEAYVLYEGAGVDTTPVQTESNRFGFYTTLKTKDNNKNDCLYYIDNDTKQAKLLIENDLTVRSAGHVFSAGAQMLRPAQDCKNSYGGGLFFKTIEDCSVEHFKESNYRRIDASDIKTNNSSVAFNGIHTYNKTNSYEIIDLSYDVGKSPQLILKKALRHFK